MTDEAKLNFMGNVIAGLLSGGIPYPDSPAKIAALVRTAKDILDRTFVEINVV